MFQVLLFSTQILPRITARVIATWFLMIYFIVIISDFVAATFTVAEIK